MKRISLLALVLVIALASMGVAYGLWSKVLTVDAVVNTGDVDAQWAYVFTDDGNSVDDNTKDNGDTGICALPLPGGTSHGSCDPKAPGPNAARWDKAVGTCPAWFDIQVDPTKLHVQIDNGYPLYFCSVWAGISNTGSIPVKIQKVTITDSNIATGAGAEVAGNLFADACGTQIDPGGVAELSGWLEVLQAAQQNGQYWVDLSIQLVQWNEYQPVAPGACLVVD
jgi:hypothetical protein